jgi:hypothetical protein
MGLQLRLAMRQMRILCNNRVKVDAGDGKILKAENDQEEKEGHDRGDTDSGHEA